MEDLYVLSSEFEKRDIVRCEKCGEYMSDLEYQTHQCSTTGGDGMNERVEIEDGTTWPNPYGEQYHDLMWKLIHAPAGLSQGDFYIIAGAMEAYNLLITHPAFTLKKVAKKISGIRKAIK